MLERPRSWYVRALRAEAAGDSEAAERAFKWVIRLDKARPYSHVAWGEFLLRQRRHDDAAKAFRAALDVAPHTPSAHLGLGRATLSSAPNEAIGHLEIAATHGEIDAFPELVRHHLGSGNTEAADTWLSAWYQQEIPVEHRLSRGSLAVKLADASARPTSRQAVDDLVQALQADPNPANMALLWAASRHACILTPVWERARRHVSNPTVNDPNRRFDDDIWTILLTDIGTTLSDRVLLERLNTSNRPDSPQPAPPPLTALPECPIAALLDEAAQKTGCNAVQPLLHAVDRAPTSPGALDALAQAYQDCGMPISARPLLLRAAELHPTTARVDAARQLLDQLGEHERASELEASP